MTTPVIAAATDEAESGARRLTRRYIAALSAVALLSIVGQLLVQSQLRGQLNDSKVVNVAGRQRMLSQRLCKCAALVAGESAPSRQAAYLTELRELLPPWRRTQAGLQHGDAELGLPRNESVAAGEVFARLEPTLTAMSAAAERITQSPRDSQTDLAVILGNEAAYLAGMDEIVSRYEAESHERVARLLRLERTLLGLTLVVLLIEGLLVFRPAARRIAASIYALRRAGEELRVAKEAAEAANLLKSRFIANMSHELRTPLHTVLGAAELLRHSNPELAKAEYLDVVDDSSRMLLCLLNDVLDLSKIEADKVDLHPTPLVVRECVRRVISMFRAEAEAKQLELIERIDAEVPQIVKLDPLRLRQVLANLLGNAIKFTERGSVTLHVSVDATSPQPAAIRFDVVDTGIGIAPDDQTKIFDSFTQLDPGGGVNIVGTSAGGAGLGLAITSRLVALMGGKLEVRSAPNRGSTFTFALPCTAATTEQPSGSSSPALVVARAERRPRKILAAEDSPVGRKILEELLQVGGHRAQCVGDGVAAVAAFERESWDIVLLDLRMPNLDGAAAAAAMRDFERRRNLRRTPIIAVTADPLPATSGAATPGDFDDYVTKPFSGATLERTIARHVPTREAGSQRESPSPRDAAQSRTDAILARLQGRHALLNELIDLFLADAPQTFATLRQAAAVGDLAELHTAAHRLRGQLETFEDRLVAPVARRLEQSCSDGDLEAARRELAALEQAWPKLLAELPQLRHLPIESAESLAS